MITVNYSGKGEGTLDMNYTLSSLGAAAARGEESMVERVENLRIHAEDFERLSGKVKYVTTTERFKDVIKTFNVQKGEIPAGFRVETTLLMDGTLHTDLIRDISYDKNGMKRPTGVVFSADSANPYEIEPIAPLLGNLTCNPGIIYDLFLNNPAANVGRKFKTREEVIKEIGRILGPGCDISVELNNPFERDFEKILDECERFKELVSEYRLVVKVPHTGPITADNVSQLMQGNKRFNGRYDQCSTEAAFMSHNLALKLREHGYRVNYTLMFEPYQTALALQAKPYFINSFIRHRMKQSEIFKKLTEEFDATGDERYLTELRAFMIENDYLPVEETGLKWCYEKAKDIIKYRKFNEKDGSDGLDSVRHNLKLLRQTKLRDTRLILCSMEGDYNYPDIDRLMTDPDYEDVIERVVITAEPKYLARFTSTNQVISYQRRFMNAVNNDSNVGKMG
ncbi:transaldolase [Bariatricus massiliensis]|uniref:Transaldolase n=1 Tax=Bariatricus massiliensis TaxID=1745713 RepID=A0ABS8DET6_9FIRM|nr:transaldolase family protein [Bariatricus massiliensis]MCB7303046.1 transaldolase [Bariatricus massiliensis]MCB7374262.1 transaldolase [Bariatricus massiliensis]MCB7386932.1 transaldolase [Bariatricus massiliensis]MCB7411094.1 transaldolase [Bariatricus massiliensis]MCQ5251920.1 transaldolase [Bariatricus massiliensis]